jgi:hypothetical protein
LRTRGYTLIEVLVAAFVTLLVMGALYQLFTRGLTLFARGQARCDLQERALSVLANIENELRHSAFSTLTVFQADPGAAPLSPRPADAAVSFQDTMTTLPSDVYPAFSPSYKWVIYLHVPREGETGGYIVRKRFAPGSTLSWRLTPDQLVAGCRQVDPTTERVIAKDVETFSVAEYGPNALAIGLAMKKYVNTTDYLEENASTIISMRNAAPPSPPPP